ncbi:zinc-regulated TonB-dependent outer membrane receptor [Halorhodospira halochloris]|uniref:zinc-regulated TonB-dependent outer membrane receptor n=1 Tax=Halorhodospira halochloris TaxID=1052 RepID=UPI001EE7D4BB|nr:zinc-regulated TonB-dependent outer membrane receptor [Halorhodospira halochloris]MCG5529989.1 zinc-regulated TonB-dependent outer membrane receptor [Halorhodospira halochloris]
MTESSAHPKAKWLLLFLTFALASPAALGQMPQGSGPGIGQQQTPEAQHRAAAAGARSSTEMVGAGTLMNPSISVIMDGVYANEFSGHVDDPGGFEMGHDHGHGHGHDHGFKDGFQLRETEFAFEATVDPYFDAFAMLVIEGTDHVDLEEAYFTTRSLPWGLQIKGGRFLSDIGYINSFHPHDWDFVDRPLASEHIFGDHGLQETGLQLNWVAPTTSYLKLGLESLQGEGGSFARHEGDYADSAGPRLTTAFAKWGPDLGFDHAAQFGASFGYNRAWHDEEEHTTDREIWDGDAWFAGLDAVYKYTPPRSYQGEGQLTIQGEWFYRHIDTDYLVYSHSKDNSDYPFGDGVGAAGNIDESTSWKQDGMYLQAVYGIAPRWRAGVRAEALGLLDNQTHVHRSRHADLTDDAGYADLDTSYRYSASVTHYPTEFSYIRGQVNYSDFASGSPDGSSEDSWQFLVQYNLSLGVHGAHPF